MKIYNILIKFFNTNSNILTQLAIHITVLLVALTFINHISKNLKLKIKTDPNNATLLNILLGITKLTQIITVLLVISSFLQCNGYSLTSLMTGLGITGLAVGFAAKESLSSLLGSIAIMTDKVYKIGDYVIINDVEGVVEAINFRSTKIKTIDNILITIKYFKNIDLTSVDNTVSSLNDELKKIKNIKDEELVSDITVYFKCSKYLDDVKYIEASSKSSLAPSLKLEDNELNYIVKLKKGSKIYYIPDSICYDVMEDDLLILKNKEPYFIIDMEKNKIINKNSDIIKVVNYTCKLIKKDDYSCMSDYKNTKVSRYINIEIGGKDEDE